MVYSPPDASPAAMSQPPSSSGLTSPRSVLPALPCQTGWEGGRCVPGGAVTLRFSRLPNCSRISVPGSGG
eukprot:3463463-Pyramimonas_sp.AAC.1